MDVLSIALIHRDNQLSIVCAWRVLSFQDTLVTLPTPFVAPLISSWNANWFGSYMGAFNGFGLPAAGINMVEKPSSRSLSQTFDTTTITIQLSVWGSACTDESFVLSSVVSAVPTTWNEAGSSLFLRKITPKPKTQTCWDVDLTYEDKADYTEISIDLGTSSTKRLQSIQTITQYDCHTPNTVTPSFNRAVGVDRDTVHGVDTLIPKTEITVLKRYDLGVMPVGYVQMIMNMVGKTNDATFSINWQGQTLTFGDQELLLVGVPMKQSGNQQLDITYKFAYQKSIVASGSVATGTVTGVGISTNVLGVTVTNGGSGYTLPPTVLFDAPVLVPGTPAIATAVLDSSGHVTSVTLVSGGTGYVGNPNVSFSDPPSGDGITIGNSSEIAKKGWEYLWVWYQQQRDTNLGIQVRTPVFAVVEQVYNTANFSVLAL